MSVALIDDRLAICPRGLRFWGKPARPHTQSHGSALFGDVALIGHDVDDRILSVGIELGAVRQIGMEQETSEVNNSDLHAETNAQEGYLLLPNIMRRADFALDSALSESRPNQYACQRIKPV